MSYRKKEGFGRGLSEVSTRDQDVKTLEICRRREDLASYIPEELVPETPVPQENPPSTHETPRHVRASGYNYMGRPAQYI